MAATTEHATQIRPFVKVARNGDGDGGDAQERSVGTLRVISYNVLANKYAFSGGHMYCDARDLKWSSRCARIIAEIDAANADIVCLQEVEEPSMQQDLLPHMSNGGYSGVLHSRDTGFVVGPREGCALFWRESALRLIDQREFAFNVAVNGVGPYFDSLRKLTEGAVVGLFEHIASGSKIVAACAHLFWDPSYPDVKVGQAHVLCGEIVAFMKHHSMDVHTTRVIIGGDFNSLWRKYRSDAFDKLDEGQQWISSGVYELMTSGQLGSDHRDHPYNRNRKEDPSQPLRSVAFHTSGLRFVSAYARAHGCEPAVTNRTQNFAGCLDYIWLSNDLFEVTETMVLPYDIHQTTPDVAAVLPPMPNAVQPSDHLCIGCTVLLQ